MSQVAEDDTIVYVVVEMLNRVPQGAYSSLLKAAYEHKVSWHQLTPWHWRSEDRKFEVVKFFVNRGLKK
jgi:hypothetical protein